MKEGSAGTAEETEEKWEDVAPDEPGLAEAVAHAPFACILRKPCH